MADRGEGRLLYGGTGENTRQVRVSRAVQGLSAGEGRPKGIWVEPRSAGHNRISRKVASTQGSGLREAPWKREDVRQLPAVDSTSSLVPGQRNRTSLGVDGVQSSADTQVAMGEIALGMDAQRREPVGIPAESTETLLPPSLPEQQQAHQEGAERGDDGDVARMGNDTPTAGAVAAGVWAPGGVDRLAVGRVSERSGRVTYYHPSLAGNLMRDGVTRYDPEAIGLVAATSWPLGTELYICGPTGRCLTGIVSDTGKLGPLQLDISEGMFKVLGGSLDRGVIAVEIGGR